MNTGRTWTEDGKRRQHYSSLQVHFLEDEGSV